MPSSPEGRRARSLRRLWIVALVTLASSGLTAFATYYAARTVRLQGEEQFHSATMEALAAVQTRMEAYLALLRGGVGLLAAEPEANRSQFKLFVDRLQIPEHYPGIQGIGFTLRVREGKEAEVLATAHKEGLTSFRLWPKTPPGQDAYTILFLEPGDKRNQAALGYNMFLEPVRREAMQKACDTGTAAASGRVKLVQEIEGPIQAGFLIYVPVYRGGGVPETVQERRAMLLGFIYSPFRSDDLFGNVLPSNVASTLDIEIYDGTQITTTNLLHMSAPPGQKRAGYWAMNMHTTLPLDVAGRKWTLRFSWHGRPDKWFLVPVVFGVGAFLTVVIALAMLSEARARYKVEFANEQLRKSEQSLREARERLQQHAQELELRVAERTTLLQQSVRDLEAVLYHVAHDLRAPVRAMGGFAAILKEEYPEHLDERAQGYLERISTGASRMDRLVSDLLSYGRLAHMPLPIDTVPLEKPLDFILQNKSKEIAQKQGTVEVQRPLPLVRANPGALSEVLEQLIDNSLKFTRPGEPPRVQIWARNGQQVRLYIKDNGIGVKPEYHERIFRVFERLHGLGAYAGTGIGLAITQKALQRMGGRVGLESTPDHGSTFWIELPGVTDV